MEYEVAVTLSTSANEMVRDVTDEEESIETERLFAVK